LLDNLLFEDFSYNGKMAFVQMRDNGDVERACMVKGSELQIDSNILVQTSIPVDDAIQPVLGVACYKTTNGVRQLINIDFVRPENELEVGKSVPLDIEVKIPKDTEEIKAFLWDSVGGMRPLCNNGAVVER
jgi:hypothetical protein